MEVFLIVPSDSLYQAYMKIPERQKSSLLLSDNLYRVLTLTAKAYTKTLLKDESPPVGFSHSLYHVLILMAKAYTETPKR